MLENSAQPLASVWKERLVCGLVFLFPIAGVSLHHWFSAIFSILFLISLWDLFRVKGGVPLFREERIWLWLCAAFFGAYLLSSTVNGWGELQVKHLGVDVRFLAVVPLYLMLRRYKSAEQWFLAGVALAAVVLAGQAYYEAAMLGKPRAEGAYSPNLLGPVAALVALWLLACWRRFGRLRWLLPLLVPVALYAVAMSGSRGAYVGLIVMALVWVAMYIRGWWRAPVLLLVLAIPLAAYHFIPSVKYRVDDAVSNVDVYIIHVEEGRHGAPGSAIRFEMWRAAWMVFKESPIVGVGPWDYQEAVKEHVGEKGLPELVAEHGHAHNAFVNTLASRGLVGFTIFMGMLFYPLYYFFKTRRRAPQTAILGILHVVGFAVFSLTDASTFIMGNFVAIFLLGMTLFLSRHVAMVHAQEEAQ